MDEQVIRHIRAYNAARDRGISHDRAISTLFPASVEPTPLPGNVAPIVPGHPGVRQRDVDEAISALQPSPSPSPTATPSATPSLAPENPFPGSDYAAQLNQLREQTAFANRFNQPSGLMNAPLQTNLFSPGGVTNVAVRRANFTPVTTGSLTPQTTPTIGVSPATVNPFNPFAPTAPVATDAFLSQPWNPDFLNVNGVPTVGTLASVYGANLPIQNFAPQTDAFGNVTNFPATLTDVGAQSNFTPAQQAIFDQITGLAPYGMDFSQQGALQYGIGDNAIANFGSQATDWWGAQQSSDAGSMNLPTFDIQNFGGDLSLTPQESPGLTDTLLGMGGTNTGPADTFAGINPFGGGLSLLSGGTGGAGGGGSSVAGGGAPPMMAMSSFYPSYANGIYFDPNTGQSYQVTTNPNTGGSIVSNIGWANTGFGHGSNYGAGWAGPGGAGFGGYGGLGGSGAPVTTGPGSQQFTGFAYATGGMLDPSSSSSPGPLDDLGGFGHILPESTGDMFKHGISPDAFGPDYVPPPALSPAMVASILASNASPIGRAGLAQAPAWAMPLGNTGLGR